MRRVQGNGHAHIRDQAVNLSRASGSGSEGWKTRPGQFLAKWTICPPEPLAISRMTPLIGRTSRRTHNVTRPFNVKLARAEIGSLHAEPAAWLTIVSVAGLRRQTLAAADDRIDHVWLRCHTT